MNAHIKNNLPDLLDRFNNILPMGDTMNEFAGLLLMPDNKFDAIYPEALKNFKKTFNNIEVQQNIINMISVMDVDKDIIEEDPEITQLIKDIKEEDTLSENKRNFLAVMLQSYSDLIVDLTKNPRLKINVQIEKLNENAKLPEYAHPSDAGADIFSAEEVTINPSETKIVSSGLKVAIPWGYEIQIRPRSGLSLKTGLRIANATATIDSEYRGTVGIIMTNTATEPYTIKIGDKIAQMVISPVPMIKWEETQISNDTDRGEGGFGSTDNKS